MARGYKPGIEAGQAEEQHAGNDVEDIESGQAQHQSEHNLPEFSYIMSRFNKIMQGDRERRSNVCFFYFWRWHLCNSASSFHN